MDPHINHSPPGSGPAKKRKRNSGLPRHWDEPEQQSSALPYDDDATDIIIEVAGAVDDAAEEEESRELTQDEMWDDSALIAAWESATAEYEAYHGKGKDWKKETVKKSPLWHNVPPDPSKLKKSTEVVQELGVTQPDPENSRPLNFETFVPNHDPSLSQPSQPAYDTYGIPPAPGEHVSRDEAFNRALGAMYWTGYWTAVYHGHGHGHIDKEGVTHEIVANGQHEKQDESADSQDEDELLISTQR